MNDFFLNSSTVGVVLSLTGYLIGAAIKQKWKRSIWNPLLVAVTLVIVFLLLFRVDYATYYSSAKYLSYFLTPATVCLAIPLYRQIQLLKKYAVPIGIGIISGVLASMGAVLGFAVLFRLSHTEYVTLLPKSVTTAIGMSISEEFGGYAEITAAVIIITGIFGNITAEFLCRIFRIKYEISRGLAIGTAAHAIGTAKAMEMGEIEGAMGSLAIVLSGLCTVAGTLIFARFI